MAKNVFVGVNNIAKKPSNIYVGVDGKAKRVKEVYAGVDGIARKVWPSSVLPNRYTQLEYIDVKLQMTDYDSILNSRILVELSLINRLRGFYIFDAEFGRNSSANDELVGYGVSSTDRQDYLAFGYSKQILGSDYSYQKYTYSNYSEGLLTDTIYTVDFLNGNNVYLYNTEGYYAISSHNYIDSYTKQTTNTPGRTEIKFFGSNYDAPIGKGYRIKAFNGSTQIRDLYPCYRNSDKYLGYFDLINQIFYPVANPSTYSSYITYDDALNIGCAIGPIV